MDYLSDEFLAQEQKRRKYVVTELRRGDMSDNGTKVLMSLLNERPDLLGRPTTSSGVTKTISTGDYDRSQYFTVKETRVGQAGIRLTTRIGSVECSEFLSSKLRSLYAANNSEALITSEYLTDYQRWAFLMLYRYSYIDPNYSRQGYLSSQGFEAISSAFGKSINLETFSAALNTTCHSFCSLFYDVEHIFGSRGSYLSMKRLRDTDLLIQVSPPRIGDITLKAVKKTVELLRKAASETPETVRYAVLFTPAAWSDISQEINESGLLVWQNKVHKGHERIEYLRPETGKGEKYPMPVVSVLSSAGESQSLSSRTVHILDDNFTL